MLRLKTTKLLITYHQQIMYKKNRGLEKNVNLLGKKYHIARKIFQHTKTDENKRKMLTESKNYKKVTNRFYSVYRRNLQTKIRKMSKNDPKQYWKLINGGKKVDGRGVDLDALYDHFKHVMNSSDDTSDDSDVVMTDFDNEEINKPITVNEIKDVIMNLKRNKAGSCDNILNEHIVHTADIFLPIYCDVFNCILDSFP